MVEGGGPGDKKAVIRTKALCPPELVIFPDNNDAQVIMINSSTRQHVYTEIFVVDKYLQVGLHLQNEIMCSNELVRDSGQAEGDCCIY